MLGRLLLLGDCRLKMGRRGRCGRRMVGRLLIGVEDLEIGNNEGP
jgi:hypothetical protein